MRRPLLTAPAVLALVVSGAVVAAAPWAGAAPEPPAATVVSVTADGQPANANATGPRLSGDGRQVAFVTTATNLVDTPGQTRGAHQVVVHEPATRRNRLASVNAEGRAGNAGAGAPAGSSNPLLSADGRVVAFNSHSTDLVAGDTNRASDVFVKDMASTEGAVRVSVTSTGEQTDRLYGSVATGISADGRRVAFTSSARNLDGSTQTNNKLYVRDREAGTTTLASFPDTAVSSWPTISADGQFAVWGNWGRPGGPDRPCPAGTWYDHGLFLRDLATGEVTTIASQPTRCAGHELYTYPSISADGRLVAYVYRDPDAPAGQRSQIYLYDRLDGTSTLVSADAAGGVSDQGSTFPRLAGDGRSMAFVSASTNLVDAPVTSASFLRRDLVTGECSVIRLNPTGGAGRSSLSNYAHDGRRIAYVDGTPWSLRVYLAEHAPDPVEEPAGPVTAGSP
jgi:Tol biopolymer transport system component